MVELLSENNQATPSFDISYDGNDDEGSESALFEPTTDKRIDSLSFFSTEQGYQASVEPNAAKRRPMGRVVGIVQRNWRSYVATIQEDGIEQGGSMHLAIPLHPVIPKIRIRHQDVKSIGNQRIVVRIDSW